MHSLAEPEPHTNCLIPHRLHLAGITAASGVVIGPVRGEKDRLTGGPVSDYLPTRLVPKMGAPVMHFPGRHAARTRLSPSPPPTDSGSGGFPPDHFDTRRPSCGRVFSTDV